MAPLNVIKMLLTDFDVNCTGQQCSVNMFLMGSKDCGQSLIKIVWAVSEEQNFDCGRNGRSDRSLHLRDFSLGQIPKADPDLALLRNIKEISESALPSHFLTYIAPEQASIFTHSSRSSACIMCNQAENE
jgi:hypothetical protein